ncbi:hypothetical protein KC921_04530 [Candidatus Woesebacteria bacterium]|nr:hypothetical protein [Candidatus Woesebacteria bacterium]
MKKLLFFLVGLVVLVLFAGVLIAGYFGFLPVVSSLFGSDKPRDLGVAVSQDQYQQYVSKSMSTVTPLKEEVDGKSLIYSGSTPLQASFSQEEVASRLNYSTWKYMPLDQVQVKFSPDGTVEVSGRLRLDRLDGFIKQVGGTEYTKADVEKGLGFLGAALTNPVVYGKGTGSVENNQVTAHIEYLEVGRLPVPLEKIPADSTFVSVANHVIGQVPGLAVKTANFDNGMLNFDGTVPTEAQILQ